MNEEKQYDFSLGGEHKLPARVKLINFASDRIKEIKSMQEALKTSTATKLVFQQLPKHMRRRVMAHNTKRLPRRLRQKHLSQLKKSGMPLKQKRPSRKYRRRPRNLLEEYTNRQRRIKWLETHIWHAKRFHMLEKWGFKLANKPCDKAFRACYRATAKHCLIQDISYINCIEIRGPSAVLINKLKSLSPQNVGLSVGAFTFLKGNREGSVTLHNESGRVGTICFHWRPAENEANERVLWIWAHAAFYDTTLRLLKDRFDLKPVTSNKYSYINNNLQVHLIELKHSLNRFRLTGPLSCAVLFNALKPVQESNSKWFTEYMKNSKRSEEFNLQYKYWRNIQNSVTAAELAPHHILCLTVIDPRYNLPKTKIKAVPQPNSLPKPVAISENLAAGPIWDSDIRLFIKENKISNAKLNEARSELLVPGTDLQDGDAVPIMLIQNPGSKIENLGYCSGWDLIVPSGWGNSFWQTLIMWGARAGGLREFNAIRFESGQLPFLTPDTVAGNTEEQYMTEACKQRYFSLPPNKRQNYNKLGIIEPFTFNWKVLINNWICTLSSIEQFAVLQDKLKLSLLQDVQNNKINYSNLLTAELEPNFLIPVRLKVQGRGTIKQFAHICFPESQDLMKNNIPREPLKEDTNQYLRKEKRQAHKKLLKKLRRERIKAKKQDRKINRDYVEELKEYSEQMRKLWLPDLTENLRRSCSRQLMGYVTFGDFSFAQARNCGVGYVVCDALKLLLQQQIKNKVLVRNISCRQYRLASIEIVI